MNNHITVSAVGERVTFGNYPQGPNGEVMPITWRVLDIGEETALLISENCLMVSGYADRKKVIGKGNKWYCMWGNSLAREMCNGHFFYEAFNVMEQKCLVPKKIEVREGPKCEDAVFLLSEKEVLKYFGGEDDRRAVPSEYIMKQHLDGSQKVYLFTDKQNRQCASWWLLPDEQRNIILKQVRADGAIEYNLSNIYHNDFTIRPCIQISSKK